MQTCFSAQHHLTDTQSSKAPAQLQKQGSRLSSVYKGLNWQPQLKRSALKQLLQKGMHPLERGYCNHTALLHQ